MELCYSGHVLSGVAAAVGAAVRTVGFYLDHTQVAMVHRKYTQEIVPAVVAHKMELRLHDDSGWSFDLNFGSG